METILNTVLENLTPVITGALLVAFVWAFRKIFNLADKAIDAWSAHAKTTETKLDDAAAKAAKGVLDGLRGELEERGVFDPPKKGGGQ